MLRQCKRSTICWRTSWMIPSWCDLAWCTMLRWTRAERVMSDDAQLVPWQWSCNEKQEQQWIHQRLIRHAARSSAHRLAVSMHSRSRGERDVMPRVRDLGTHTMVHQDHGQHSSNVCTRTIICAGGGNLHQAAPRSESAYCADRSRIVSSGVQDSAQCHATGTCS